MNIDQVTLDKLHLCFNEIAKCKQLLDSGRVDDFCGRLLSIYIMLRVDDITKIWSHSIPKGDIERLLSDEVKSTYNNGFRLVRDKLGAHYQTTAENKDVDIFENSNLFRSFDHKSVSEFIDELFATEQLIEGNDIQFKGFGDVNDLMMALAAIDSLYADDTACITNSALDLFGFNKGGLITFTNEQRKAQFLKGIELMVSYAHCLAAKPYHSIEDKRLFKRLLVCVIYNYHDNLYTRKELRSTAEQYEEGFDLMYKRLYSTCDNREMLDTVFDKFEKIYHTDVFFKSNRKIRDHACGHFDEKSNVDEINCSIDSLSQDEIYEQYCNMLHLFNFICNNMLSLTCFRIPPRSILNNTQMVSMDGVTNFYGEKLNDIPAITIMSVDEIMRSIRKHDAHYDEACAQMRDKLFSQNPDEYYPMMAVITQRLREMSNYEPELFDIIKGLQRAKRGFPNRLQQSLVALLNDEGIDEFIKVHLIWVLSSVCTKDKNLNIEDYLAGLVDSDCYSVQCLVFIGYLHYLMSDGNPIVNCECKPHEVDKKFSGLLLAITNPSKALGIWLALNQHWMLDSDYAIARKREAIYDSFLKEGLHNSILVYFKYAKIGETDELKLWGDYEKTCHYLLLLYRFASFERIRKQNPNAFIELWNSNCFIRYRAEMYESFGVGLMTELNGNIDMARDIFKTIVKNNPINQDAIKILADFEERNRN